MLTYAAFRRGPEGGRLPLYPILLPSNFLKSGLLIFPFRKKVRHLFNTGNQSRLEIQRWQFES